MTRADLHDHPTGSVYEQEITEPETVIYVGRPRRRMPRNGEDHHGLMAAAAGCRVAALDQKWIAPRLPGFALKPDPSYVPVAVKIMRLA